MNTDLQNRIAYLEQQRRAKPRAPKQKGNQLLKTLLSIGGGTVGTIGGAALGALAGGVGAVPGAAAGGAIGSGVGTALGRAFGGESVLGEGGAGEILLDTALGAIPAGFGKAAKAGKAGKSIFKIGGRELGDVATGRLLKETAGEAGVQAGAAVGRRTTGKLAQALEQAGRGGTIARTSTLPSETAQAGLADLTRKYPAYFAGSGKKKFVNVDKFIADKTAEADNLLKGITKTTPTSQIKNEFARYSNNLAGVEKTQFDNITNTIFKPLANKTQLSATELNGIRREINKKFPNIFTKQQKGGQLTGAEIAADDIRQILGKKIDDLGGKNVKAINKEISQALQARPEFKKLKEQVSRIQVPFTNTPVPGAETIRQTGADILGRVAGGRAAQTGRDISRGRIVGGTLLGQTLAQTLGGSLASQPEQADMTGMEQGGMEDMTGMAGDMGTMGDMGGIDEGTQQQADIDAYFQGLALQDLQQTGGKRLSAIKNAYDLFGGGKAEKKSISQQNAERKLRQARGVVDTLEQELRAAGGPGGFGRVVERGLANIPELGGTISPRVAAFENARQGSLALISKALGESGVLTDQDIKRALNFVPTITDSPEQAARKFRILRSYLDLGSEGTVGTDTRFNF